MAKNILTHSKAAWSLLDPKPVLHYLESCDEYIVFWNGLVMPHTMALNIAGESFGIYPTPAMKEQMSITYNKIYYSGGFDTREWDGIVTPNDYIVQADGKRQYTNPSMINVRVYNYLRKEMTQHIIDKLESFSHAELLASLDYTKGIPNES